MSKIRKIVKVCFIFVIAEVLSSCMFLAASGAGAVVLSARDRRTTGTIVEDQTIELQSARIIHELAKDKETHINVVSYNMRVLITGEVDNQQLGVDIVARISKLNKVEKVFNELIVAQPSSLASRSNDAFITSKVKSLLVSVVDPTRVKVITERGTVYLLGIVTKDEGKKAIERAQEITGVRNTVHLFQFYSPSN